MSKKKPVTTKAPRKIIQITHSAGRLVALADDGTLWRETRRNSITPGNMNFSKEWTPHPLGDLPEKEVPVVTTSIPAPLPPSSNGDQ